MNNEQQNSISLTAPSLPKGGGAIQGTTGQWGQMEMTGNASYTLPLPVEPARGITPPLSLHYQSGGGKSTFGTGWSCLLPAIVRQASKGVPAYRDDDVFLGPDGDALLPEMDASGNVVVQTYHTLRGEPLNSEYTAVRYFPRNGNVSDRLERWQDASHTFWVQHTADGVLHIFGYSTRSEFSDAGKSCVVGWHLDESVFPTGDHIQYTWKTEDSANIADNERRDRYVHQYLYLVAYGFQQSVPVPFCLSTPEQVPVAEYYVKFGYGAESTDPLVPVDFDALSDAWPARPDPYSGFEFGTEIRVQRLCHQVLQYRRIRGNIQLTRRALLEYALSPVMTYMTAVQSVAYDGTGKPTFLPPVEFSYTGHVVPEQGVFTPFDPMPGLNDGQHYQFVDLFGDGVPGILCQDTDAWYYREPVRDPASVQDITYAPATPLPRIPASATSLPVAHALYDATGNGCLDWVVTSAGMAGFYAFTPEKRWTQFIPFPAFPSEFIHPTGQMVDLTGNGISDFALIGPRSVRLYPGAREDGFLAPRDVAGDNSAELPLIRPSKTEMVGFSDIMGSGCQHLVRIRHDEVTCWPNLGHGKFGKPLSLSPPQWPSSVSAADFNPDNLRLADIDGSGAADIIYPERDGVWIFINQSGNGFASPAFLPWPEGVSYDSLTQMSVVDLDGLGCSQLVITQPYPSPRHWRCDFNAGVKPHLLMSTDNNMGAEGTVTYRSSAQEWLDEKAELMLRGQPGVSHLPFPVHVVTRQIQKDQITGREFSQCCAYRGGYYDGTERELRGFALVIQKDTDQSAENSPREDFIPPVTTKTWFHTGTLAWPAGEDYFRSDADAAPGGKFALGGLLCSRLQDGETELLPWHDGQAWGHQWDEQTRRDAARNLAGSVLRSEVYAGGSDTPLTVTENRLMVRHLPAPARQSHQRFQVLGVENRVYRYEHIQEDPEALHRITLTWDEAGVPLSEVSVAYARRLQASDIDRIAHRFPGEYEKGLWTDAHDDAQQRYHFTESLSTFVHSRETGWWRLHLPDCRRVNVLEMPSLEIKPEADLCFEGISGRLRTEDLTLAGLSVQHYQGTPYALFYGLVDGLETAELDADSVAVFTPFFFTQALERLLEADSITGEGKRYTRLRTELRQLRLRDIDDMVEQLISTQSMPAAQMMSLCQSAKIQGDADFERYLNELGYEKMEEKLPEGNMLLWSARRGRPVYNDVSQFLTMKAYRETHLTGYSTVDYDEHHFVPVLFTDAAGCMTRTTYDYRTMQPVRIVDPNDNTHEALCDAFGRPIATSFYGTEMRYPPQDEVGLDAADETVVHAGFAGVSDFVDKKLTPDEVLASGKDEMQGMATVVFTDTGCWMGKVAGESETDMASLLARRIITPDGYLRSWARKRLDADDSFMKGEAIRERLRGLKQRPAMALSLLSDRYNDDPDRQVRQTIASFDGFGRVLQTRQRVEPGEAYAVGADGRLIIEGGKPKIVEASSRWRVSERVEYNNKGLAVRVYRPYFSDSYHYIDDVSFRDFGLCDRQFYDELGRPLYTLTAANFMRRTHYNTWYKVDEDENDTALEMEQSGKVMLH